MPRSPRITTGGIVYHVLNRANARVRIFETPQDYAAFEQVLDEALTRVPMRLLAYCLMPNHWHLVLWPQEAGTLSTFMRWLTLTHTQRWHTAHGTTGAGHLYQGRFKSFPVQTDLHVLTVCRYVERNALRAGLVERAEMWRWSSLWYRHHTEQGYANTLCSEWPVARPHNWVAWVNSAESAAELEALRRCVVRGSPYGSERWMSQTATQLGLASTLRPRGRPRKGNP